MTLKPADAEFLLRILSLEKGLRRRLQEFRTVGLPLSDDDKDKLRELVADQLQVQGFDDDYTLTPIGHRLEELIDMLYVDKGAV